MARKKKTGLNRREAIKAASAAALGAAVGAGAGSGGALGAEKPLKVRPPSAFSRQAEVPGFGGTRVVVIGGGWSGLETARQLKKNRRDLDVILIEKRASFFSCPLSNLWLVDRIPLDDLTHSFIDAAHNNDYTWLHAAVVDMDRHKRVIYTDQGWLTYDFLVVAPGIDYDYARFGVADPGDAARLRAAYPAAFMAGSELLTLKRKLEEFDGGVFVLTAPPGNYRCLPAPYERACMIAGYMKDNDIKGRVLLLDSREHPPFHPDGINEAIRDLYRRYVVRIGGVNITGVDIGKRRIETEMGEIVFTDAAIYPPVRGSRVLERFGIADMKDPGRFADIDPISYRVRGDERVFVGGDARPMPFIKAGIAANHEAGHIARVITSQMEGKDFSPLSSQGLMCYVAVNAQPLQSVAFKISFGWVYDRGTGEKRFVQKAQAFPKRSRSLGKANIQWGRGMFQEMFYNSL